MGSTEWILAGFGLGLFGGWGLKELWEQRHTYFGHLVSKKPFDWEIEYPWLIKTGDETRTPAVRVIEETSDDEVLLRIIQRTAESQ